MQAVLVQQAQCAWVDDRDELIEGTPELGTQTNQATPFYGLDDHTRRQPAPENLVLRLQLGDVAGQLLLRRSRQNQQKRSVDVPHPRNPSNLASDQGLAPFLHTGISVFRQEYDAISTVDGEATSAFRERSRALCCAL